LFSNYDENGEPYARPNTLLIDSVQLESGDALDQNFRQYANHEIEQFRREIVERTGDMRSAENLTDADLLREVMNTVGKPGRLGADIRCVVSVSMLTEGWDANNVTHILGIRPFGTQLLCEQVVGRALRRQSYSLNEQGLFNVEYADILGIPFNFTAKPVVAKPAPPRETVHVRAIRPERDALEIKFPRVQGYRVELPEDNIDAKFDPATSTLVLTPELVGATEVQVAGIIGAPADLTIEHTADVRPSQVLFELTAYLVRYKWPDGNGDPRINQFGALKRVVRRWLDEGYLICKGGTTSAQLKYKTLADMACEKIIAAITVAHAEESPMNVILDPYVPESSTAFVNFNTSKLPRWETSPAKCHVNWAVLDSEWEKEFCRVAESHPKVRAYVKNSGLGFEVPYNDGGEARRYLPDFIVLVDDGHGDDDLLHVVVEIKGFQNENSKAKREAMNAYWVPGVNNLGTYGRWKFVELADFYEIKDDFETIISPRAVDTFDQLASTQTN
jgi:type III restriction enzyme